MALMNSSKSGFHQPLSEQALEKFSQESGLRHYLKWLARYDVEMLYHGFTDVSVANLGWTVENSGGASAADLALPATKLNGGGATILPGTTDNGSASAIHYLQWKGDNNVKMLVRGKVSVLTGGYNLELGLVDARPGSNAPVVTDVDTPTAAMTDGAVVSIDVDQTIKTLCFVTAGTSFTTTATSALLTPSADTYFTAFIEIVGDNAYCSVNGIRGAAHLGSKVEGGTLLAPWIYARNRDTTAKTVTVDYVLVAQGR